MRSVGRGPVHLDQASVRRGPHPPFLDGALVSMSLVLSRSLDVEPGRNVLQAEFAAADHGPFDPRVRTSVAFQVVER